MSRGMKGLISTMLVLVMLGSMSYMPIEAKQTDVGEKNDETIQVRFTHIDTFNNRFDISDRGKASISTILWANNVDELEINGYLQQYKNGKWNTIKTWSRQTKETEGLLTESWYIDKGYFYRYKSNVFLYSEGSLCEKTGFISGNVYY
jgi:hypothetical protein